MTARRPLAVPLITAVSLITAALSPLAAPSPVRADDRAVVATVPADGAALTAPPESVLLRTAGSPDLALSHLSVRDDAGDTVDTGDVRAATSRALAVPVRATAPGTFTATYHVVLTDGRSGSGAVRFSVGTGVAPPAPPVAPADAHQHGIDGLSAVLLTVDLLVLAGALLMLRLRPPTGTPPADRPRWRLDDPR